MQVLVSGKQIELGESLRAHAETEIVATVNKYFQNAIRSSIVVSRESDLFRVEISVDVGHDLSFQGHGQAPEPYVAFDLALGHTAKQLRRHKRKLRNHRHTEAPKIPIAEN